VSFIPQSESSGVAFSCDRSGRILSVVRDDLHLAREGRSMLEFVDRFSLEKARNFLAALVKDQVSFGWDLNVNLNGRPTSITFNGACTDSCFLVVGATSRSGAVRFVEALSAINSEQTTALRSALKQIADQQRDSEIQEATLFDELSRLNNELVTLQRELAAKNRSLEKLNRLKDTFLGMASHDLRKPISGILTLTDILFDAEAPPSPQQQAYLSSIKDASRKVIRQLNDFLDIAQIESGKLHLEKSPVSLAALLSRRATSFLHAARAKQIELTTEILGDIPKLHLDPDRIEQVIDNLVENALKYTPSHGRVILRLECSSSAVILSVRDTGPGLSAEQVKILFNAFQTAGSKTTGGEKSTGLGLAIVKAILDGHNASISVQSEPTLGATFIIRFPAAPSAPGAPGAPS
jgi:signal transduction histidine kinase